MYHSTRQPTIITDPSNCRHDWEETCKSGIEAICTRCGSWKIETDDAPEEKENGELF